MAIKILKIWRLRYLLVLTVFILVLLPVQYGVCEVYYAANNGLDHGACGSQNFPCRSITKALSRTRSGDTVIVGPGRYGDLNLDGDLNDEGEEDGDSTENTLILINKRVRIIARDGRDKTVIDGASFFKHTIKVSADGVAIGRDSMGFSIIGGTQSSIFVKSKSVQIVGNKVNSSSANGIEVGCTTGESVEDLLTKGQIVDNIADHNGANGIILCSNTARWSVRSNEAKFNGSDGIAIFGVRHKLIQNNMLGNGADGLEADGESFLISKNSTIANGRIGLNLGGDSPYIARGNSTVGTALYGAYYESTSSFTANNVYGNNAAELGGDLLNCGLLVEVEGSNFSSNYWGSQFGMGDDPADLVCSSVSASTTANFAKKERRARVKTN